MNDIKSYSRRINVLMYAEMHKKTCYIY